MGFLVVTAVLVVGFGRLGDMYGRVRMYNLGFVVFTVASILLAVTWQTGDAAALWLIGWRIVQGVGGAFIMANSTAILTDAFPADQRGTALGHQRRRRDRGLVPRPGDRRPARPRQLAPGLPRLGALRDLRHDLGLPQAARHRRAQAREDGLVGQHHVRRRPHRPARRHHLRHPALRRQHHGLGQPARAHLRRSAGSSCWCCSPSSRARSPTRCSRSRCSGSAPSPSATSRSCSPRSVAAACSSS